MLDLEELVETGVVTVALSFGVITGATVFLSGSLDGVAVVATRFFAALKLTLVPSPSLASWPNVVGVAVAVAGAFKLDDEFGLKLAAFLAAYLFVTLCLHYVAALV